MDGVEEIQGSDNVELLLEKSDCEYWQLVSSIDFDPVVRPRAKESDGMTNVWQLCRNKGRLSRTDLDSETVVAIPKGSNDNAKH